MLRLVRGYKMDNELGLSENELSDIITRSELVTSYQKDYSLDSRVSRVENADPDLAICDQDMIFIEPAAYFDSSFEKSDVRSAPDYRLDFDDETGRVMIVPARSCETVTTDERSPKQRFREQALFDANPYAGMIAAERNDVAFAVSRFAEMIGKEAKLSDDELRSLRKAAAMSAYERPCLDSREAEVVDAFYRLNDPVLNPAPKNDASLNVFNLYNDDKQLDSPSILQTLRKCCSAAVIRDAQILAVAYEFAILLKKHTELYQAVPEQEKIFLRREGVIPVNAAYDELNRKTGRNFYRYNMEAVQLLDRAISKVVNDRYAEILASQPGIKYKVNEELDLPRVDLEFSAVKRTA